MDVVSDRGGQAKYNLLLIVLLIIVPAIIMWVMGFGNFDANEFNILEVALLADAALLIGYTLLTYYRRFWDRKK